MTTPALPRPAAVILMFALLVVSGCGGGGGSGSISIRPDPPTRPTESDPTLEAVDPDPPTQGDSPSLLAQITDSIENLSAEDLLEHWDDPEVLREETGTSRLSYTEASARILSLKAISQAPQGDPPDESLMLLRNVDPDSVSVVGEHDGVTYGQWRSGPAGTLDIDFDYRFAPELDESERAYIERAGKSWSWRLTDNFGTHTVPAGRQIDRARVIGGVSVEELRLDAEVVTDGLPIFVDRHDGTPRSRGSWRGDAARIDENMDFEPLFGAIRMGKERFDQVASRGNFALVSLIAHEIGHVLGISLLHDNNITFYDELVDESAGTFNGPNSVAANGGNPVPFQWLDANLRAVEPHTPGATIDYTHPAPCTYVMSYCSFDNDLFAPSELDLAFLADLGFEVREAGTEQEAEIYGFGAWGRYGAWGAGVERTISYEQERRGSIHDVTAHDSLRAGADAFGIVPSADFADANRSVTGSVTWSGSLLGVDLGQRMLPPVFGDAELSVELSDLSGMARFDNLTVVVDGTPGAFRSPDLEYGIDVTGNTFTDEDGHVEGGFFGPAHEEMAGVLHDTTGDVNLLAGFGGTRDGN